LFAQFLRAPSATHSSRTGFCSSCYIYFCLLTDAWGCPEILFPKSGIGNDVFIKRFLLSDQRLFLCCGRRAATTSYLEPCGRRTILCVFSVANRDALVVW